LDPILSKLATGKLELDVTSDPLPATRNTRDADVRGPLSNEDKEALAKAATAQAALQAGAGLGRIQPPGGVPLNFGRPGEEIRADASNQATKRLESAPVEALDKWVLELERIMDKKLDGAVAKQACRTYFVAHMNIAFDDLTWNAKAADK